jgi:hypothetical protein
VGVRDLRVAAAQVLVPLRRNGFTVRDAPVVAPRAGVLRQAQTFGCRRSCVGGGGSCAGAWWVGRSVLSVWLVLRLSAAAAFSVSHSTPLRPKYPSVPQVVTRAAEP